MNEASACSASEPSEPLSWQEICRRYHDDTIAMDPPSADLGAGQAAGGTRLLHPGGTHCQVELSRAGARQLRTRAFHRRKVKPAIVSAALTQLHPTAIDEFKNAYCLEFLDVRNGYSEADLHGALLHNLGRFINELGRDFCFVGSEYPVQVGNRDFAIDLVFFHRGLSCLVAFELKVRKFEPADLGQLSFYVEALDRDVRKPHERPSIGVLLCATKDDEVVEYALARTTSPTLAAEYQTMLPTKALLRRKLHELYARLAPDGQSGVAVEEAVHHGVRGESRQTKLRGRRSAPRNRGRE